MQSVEEREMQGRTEQSQAHNTRIPPVFITISTEWRGERDLARPLKLQFQNLRQTRDATRPTFDGTRSRDLATRSVINAGVDVAQAW